MPKPAILLRHHSPVELIDRAVVRGLVERVRDPDDQRVVRLRLTVDGARAVASLAAQHRAELDRLRPQMQQMWAGLDVGEGPTDRAANRG